LANPHSRMSGCSCGLTAVLPLPSHSQTLTSHAALLLLPVLACVRAVVLCRCSCSRRLRRSALPSASCRSWGWP
jgi:hypothetical protein